MIHAAAYWYPSNAFIIPDLQVTLEFRQLAFICDKKRWLKFV